MNYHILCTTRERRPRILLRNPGGALHPKRSRFGKTKKALPVHPVIQVNREGPQAGKVRKRLPFVKFQGSGGMPKAIVAD